MSEARDRARRGVTRYERSLVHEAPAIVGCRTPSALAHAALARQRMPAANWGVAEQ